MNRKKLTAALESQLLKLEQKFYEMRGELKFQRRRLFYLKTPEDFYPEDFFRRRTRGVRQWETALGKALVETLGVKNLVDFGCATGSFLEGALQGGAKKVLGIELAYENSIKFTPKHIQPFIKKGNAGARLRCGKWDCVLSIEVAEHLIEEEADIFVDNLISAAKKYIVLTASNSPYKYHLNPQPKEYWIGKIISKGCTLLHAETKQLCEIWRPLCSVGRTHVIDHLMIFSAPEGK